MRVKTNNQEKIVTLQDLDICYSTWCNITDDFQVPLFIHIKDIKTDYENIGKIEKVEFLRSSVRLNETGMSPFKKYYEDYLIKKEIIYILSFIDDRKMFNNKTFLEEFFNCNTAEEFYYILMKKGITDYQINKLKNEVEFYIKKVKDEFTQKCMDFFDYNRKFPDIKLKDELSKEITDLLIYSYGMTMVQSGFEYTNSIIFSENKDKAMNEFSWREVEFKAMYSSMENKIKSFSNKYYAKKAERDK